MDEELSKLNPEDDDEKLAEDEFWLDEEPELDQDELDWKEKLCPAGMP